MGAKSMSNNVKGLILAILFSFIATLSAAQFAWAEFTEGSHAVQFNFGFTKGGTALGADYEFGFDRTFGIGGYVRMYPDSSSNPESDGLTAMGVFVRPHFNRQSWDFYVSPGFGMISYEPQRVSDETLLGPSFAIGLLYEFNSKMSFGVEEMRMYSWFGEEDYRGEVSQSAFMGKFRFIF